MSRPAEATLQIAEARLDTQTVMDLKSLRGRREYLFVITESELQQLRSEGVPPAAILTYMAIRGAVRASGAEWAAISVRTRQAFDFPAEWWRLNVRRLEQAGFIECDRKPGKSRRYRLTGASAAAVSESSGLGTRSRTSSNRAEGGPSARSGETQGGVYDQ